MTIYCFYWLDKIKDIYTHLNVLTFSVIHNHISNKIILSKNTNGEEKWHSKHLN
jgi:hypothetical protein